MATDGSTDRSLSLVPQRAFETEGPVRLQPGRVADAEAEAEADDTGLLRVDVRRSGDLTVAALSGVLTSDTGTVLAGWPDLPDPSQVDLVLDLTGVTALDGGGLTGLLAIRARARQGGSIGVVCPDPEMGRRFWATGICRFFLLRSSLDEVREAFAERS